MTDEILQTDIDLARRLIDEGRADAEIIDLLARRKIASNRASRLISELREGRAVEPDRVWRSVALQGEPTVSPSRQTTASSQKEGRNRPSARIRVPWFRILVAAGVLFCIGMAVWFGRQRNERVREQSRQAGAASAPKTSASESVDAAGLQIEIGEGALKLRGQQIGREDALRVFASTLGPPSRTNHVEGVDKIVYLFDDYGVLIYPGGGDNPNSVVIDFEGTGGTHSTAKPFTGKVRILEEDLNRDTDPKTLSIMEKLNARDHAGNTGIYNLQLKGLRVVLASLARADRISLITIDFEESWGKALH